MVKHHRMQMNAYRAQEGHHMGCPSIMNDSNGQAGPQGGHERGFLAQIGSSLVTSVAVRHTKELFVTGRPLKHSLNID